MDGFVQNTAESGRTRLYISGIPETMSVETLQDYLSTFGEVITCQISTHASTGKSRGFGFVIFRQPEEADRAIYCPHDHIVQGTKLYIKEVHSPTEVLWTELKIQPKKVYVEGIPLDTDRSQLLKFFENFGPVEELSTLHKTKTNHQLYCFVVYENEVDARELIRNCDVIYKGATLHARKPKIDSKLQNACKDLYQVYTEINHQDPSWESPEELAQALKQILTPIGSEDSSNLVDNKNIKPTWKMKKPLKLQPSYDPNRYDGANTYQHNYAQLATRLSEQKNSGSLITRYNTTDSTNVRSVKDASYIDHSYFGHRHLTTGNFNHTETRGSLYQQPSSVYHQEMSNYNHSSVCPVPTPDSQYMGYEDFGSEWNQSYQEPEQLYYGDRSHFNYEEDLKYPNFNYGNGNDISNFQHQENHYVSNPFVAHDSNFYQQSYLPAELQSNGIVDGSYLNQPQMANRKRGRHHKDSRNSKAGRSDRLLHSHNSNTPQANQNPHSRQRI